MGMNNNDGKKSFIPMSIQALSRIVSSGASTVASTVKSAASAIMDRDNNDQVIWAGFDKLECEGGITRQILLLGCRYGFQVWDVEDSANVHNLVSRQDGPVSFLQMLPKPMSSTKNKDKLSGSHPVLIFCGDGSFPGDNNIQEGQKLFNGTSQQYHPNQATNSFVPTVVWFYSLKSCSYVHLLKFRSVVHLIRCTSRVIAVLQASQIHCFDAATLEREYIVVTNPVIPTGFSGFGTIGVGPLALGPRWMAYSGSPVIISNSGLVSLKLHTSSASFPSQSPNGSLVAHYAKESSKRLADGIMALGGIGHKKLSRYYSEVSQSGNTHVKIQATQTSHFTDADNVGMVIVRDIVSKALIAQFRAHKSPISALCFDPSGTLLVTASVQGHNINIFCIMPKLSDSTSAVDHGSSFVHLYRLQRGLTNAVIQDISFSSDSKWISVSSAKGTSHLFALSPSACAVKWYEKGPPMTLSVVGRIRSGGSGWRNNVSSAAVAATGRTNSFLGSIAAAFQHCRSTNQHGELKFGGTTDHLLIFSSPGSMIRYSLSMCSGLDSLSTCPAVGSTWEADHGIGTRLEVVAIQKWNFLCKQYCKEQGITDIYGEFGNSDSSKVYPVDITKGNDLHFEDRDTIAKEKMTSVERHQIYLSEAEVRVHEPQFSLWGNTQVFVQPFIMDGIYVVDECCGGEVGIEGIPAHIFEARHKRSVLSSCPLESSSTQKGRVCADGDGDEQSSPRPEVSLRSAGGYGSLRSLNEPSSEPHPDIETECSSLQVNSHVASEFVISSDSSVAATPVDFVKHERNYIEEAQFEIVNANIDGAKAEYHLEIIWKVLLDSFIEVADVL